MELTLNTTGLVLDIIGCILLFCESFKMRIFYEKKQKCATSELKRTPQD
jgi:hypothetical protein